MKVDSSWGLSLVPSACPVLGSFSLRSDGVLRPRVHDALGHQLQLLSERIVGSFCKTASGLSVESLAVGTCCRKGKLRDEKIEPNGAELTNMIP